MRCIICNKIKNGITINGVSDKYRICVDCIKKIDIPPEVRMHMPISTGMFKNELSQRRYETKVKKAYLQEQVDKKLWEWLR